jgi:hypothetical protein
MEMIRELDRVVLVVDFPEYRLKAGDVGTVVHVYNDGEGYEIEVFTLDGHTLEVITASAKQIRPVQRNEVAHARIME